MKVLLLSNTYPYRGEAFLRTEAELLPEDVQVRLFPFFPDRQHPAEGSVPPQVCVESYPEPSAGKKLRCFFRGLRTFFAEREFRAAFRKKHPLRNIGKAVKFAAISEMRVLAVRERLAADGEDGQDLRIYAYWMYETAYVGARLKAMLPGSRLITRCHRYDLYEEVHPGGYLPFRNFILRQADLVCPISENGAAYLEKLYGDAAAAKIRISRLGTIRRAEIPAAREKEDGILLVSCSNLVPVKRVDRIIRALKKCDRQVCWIHFGDGALRGDLERQAAELPANIRFRFMGYQPNEEIQKFYAEHCIDAFVNVSGSEGVPVSIMEAQSYGIPVIATDVGGTSELVHDGKNGTLLRVDFTDEEFLSALGGVLGSAEAYRADALRTWQTMSDAHRVFPEFYQLLAEV